MSENEAKKEVNKSEKHDENEELEIKKNEKGVYMKVWTISLVNFHIKETYMNEVEYKHNISKCGFGTTKIDGAVCIFSKKRENIEKFINRIGKKIIKRWVFDNIVDRFIYSARCAEIMNKEQA